MTSSQIALVLIDLAGFDKTIWKYTEILRGWEIPFLILSPGKNPYLLQEVTKRGASQVLIKPLVSKDLLNIIQSLLGQ
jgi:DNA-binding response OmpR family regulator